MKINFPYDGKLIFSLWDSTNKAGSHEVPVLFDIKFNKYKVEYEKFVHHIDNDIFEFINNLPDPISRKYQASISLIYRYSKNLLPGFMVYIKEAIYKEWLALVGYEKKFHRDHILHQVQTAVVAKKLMEELYLSPEQSSIVKQLNSCIEIPPDHRLAAFIRKDGYTALILTLAFSLCCQNIHNCHILTLAEELSIPERCLQFNGDNNDNLRVLEYWCDLIYDAAIVAALYHDIGYPYQLLFNYRESLSDFLTNIIKIPQTNSEIKEELSNRLILKYLLNSPPGNKSFNTMDPRGEYNELLGNARDKTHGFIGAILFAKLNDEYRVHNSELNNPRGFLIYEMAINAIARHDLSGQYFCKIKDKNSNEDLPEKLKVKYSHLRINSSDDPVSFIVTLADQIQSSGRYNSNISVAEREEKTDRDHKYYTRLQFNCPMIATVLHNNYQTGNIELKYVFHSANSEDELDKREKFNPTDQNTFFNRSIGYLDYRDLCNGITLATDILQTKDTENGN